MDMIDEIGTAGTRPPAHKRVLLAMAYDDKIRLNLSSEIANFDGGLTSDQLGDRIEAKLLQPLHTFVEDANKSNFSLSRCSGVVSISQGQPRNFADDR